MNRIMYFPGEVENDRLRLSDHRAEHLRSVLNARTGDVFRGAEVDGALSVLVVEKITPADIELRVQSGEIPPRPDLNLLLALPRPKVLKRLLPQLAALGVDRLWLCGARRVERYYFDSHVLEESFMKKALVDGLSQSGHPALPRVEVFRSLLQALIRFPDAAEEERWLLHPPAATRLTDLPRSRSAAWLALGPEGGWVPEEIEQFAEKRFIPVSLMERILRTDTACVAAVSAMVLRGESDGGS